MQPDSLLQDKCPQCTQHFKAWTKGDPTALYSSHDSTTFVSRLLSEYPTKGAIFGCPEYRLYFCLGPLKDLVWTAIWKLLGRLRFSWLSCLQGKKTTKKTEKESKKNLSFNIQKTHYWTRLERLLKAGQSHWLLILPRAAFWKKSLALYSQVSHDNTHRGNSWATSNCESFWWDSNLERNVESDCERDQERHWTPHRHKWIATHGTNIKQRSFCRKFSFLWSFSNSQVNYQPW